MIATQSRRTFPEAITMMRARFLARKLAAALATGRVHGRAVSQSTFSACSVQTFTQG